MILRILCGVITSPIFAILILGYAFYLVGKDTVTLIKKIMCYAIDGVWGDLENEN